MLHQGLAELTGLTIGVVSIVVGAVVLLLWIPLRQRPGLGTVSNVFVVGLAMDGTLALVPDAHGLAVRIPLLVAGIVLNGVATGLYIAARFGRAATADDRTAPAHRPLDPAGADGRRGGGGGDRLRPGRLGRRRHRAYALAIGPLAQLFLRVFAVPAARGSTVVAAGHPDGRYCAVTRVRHPYLDHPGRSPSPTAAGRRTGWRTPPPRSAGPPSSATATSRPMCTPRPTASSSPSTTRPWTG